MEEIGGSVMMFAAAKVPEDVHLPELKRILYSTYQTK
jgi:hypothetical protein